MAAAQVRFVDDVVVQQRRRVDHLDHRRQRVMVRSRVAAGARRQQQQRGAQPLAAAADDVLGDLADQRDVGIEARAQHAVDLGHVGGEQRVEDSMVTRAMRGLMRRGSNGGSRSDAGAGVAAESAQVAG